MDRFPDRGRRRFLRRAAALAGGVALTGGCRREAGRDGSTAPPVGPGALAWWREALDSGRISSADLLRHLLARVEALDRQGPELRAVLEANPDAPAQVADCDRELAAGIRRGPLHGIPVFLKGNIATADAMQTDAGSLALRDARPAADAALVAKLREAGAVIPGKTNLSEWANFRGRGSSSGWSAVGGQTRNPHRPACNPGGSSSGSAAAVAAGYGPLAVGTETDGSIVNPASSCGIAALKPTRGLISRRGILPIAHSLDTAGPMACGVADLAVLLNVLTCPEPADRGALTPPWTAPPDFTVPPDGRSLRGCRIGVVREWFSYCRDVLPVAEAAIAAMQRCGAVVVDPVRVRFPPELRRAETVAMHHEFKDGLNRWLQALPSSPVRSLADVIAFNNDHRDLELAGFGQSAFLAAEACGGLDAPEYLEAIALVQSEPDRVLTEAMAEHGLDALCAVSAAPAPPMEGGGPPFVSCSSLPAMAGWPHLTLPAAFVDGLPVGLSLIGRPWSEADLLARAFDLERELAAFRAPSFAAG